jgi:hypothetical protein
VRTTKGDKLVSDEKSSGRAYFQAKVHSEFSAKIVYSAICTILLSVVPSIPKYKIF